MNRDLQFLCEEYKRSMEVRGLAPRTVTETLAMLKRFITRMEARGITHADKITREAVKAYQVEIYESLNVSGRTNSIGYQNHLMGVVKQFLRFLKEEGYIISDPSKGIEYAKEPKRLPRTVLTLSEARKILHAPDTKSVIGYRDRTMLEVLYSTGIRKEELGSLKLGDVDYQGGFLRITSGKGGKDRVVPLGRIACRYLENYIRSVRIELIKDPYNDHLFLSQRGGRLTKNSVLVMVKKYAKKAKVRKNVYPHAFRHTCATHMLRNKADIRVIQELLGHASLKSTQIYTHVSITDLKEVHARCHPREKDPA